MAHTSGPPRYLAAKMQSLHVVPTEQKRCEMASWSTKMFIVGSEDPQRCWEQATVCWVTLPNVPRIFELGSQFWDLAQNGGALHDWAVAIPNVAPSQP